MLQDLFNGIYDTIYIEIHTFDQLFRYNSKGANFYKHLKKKIITKTYKNKDKMFIKVKQSNRDQTNKNVGEKKKVRERQRIEN